MSNIYFQPTEIDGSPRRAIVERVAACRPKRADTGPPLVFDREQTASSKEFAQQVCDEFFGGNKQPVWSEPRFHWPDGVLGPVDDWIALRLTRLAVIEWLNGHYRTAPSLLVASLFDVLCYGANDEDRNAVAHRLADALNIPH